MKVRTLVWNVGGLAAAAWLGALTGATAAEPEPAPELETLLVTAPRPEPLGPVSETHHSLDAGAFELLRPQNAADLLRRLPAAHVPVNSRGESLVYLRSAGERQVAAFFDGALLNVPWDNRYDLSLLPAAVLGRVATASGTLSPQYGVNALGAVAFFPVSPPAEGMEARLDLRLGTQGERGGQALWGARAGPVRLLAAGGGFHRDGNALPDSVNLPFHQQDDELRVNTDRTRQNALVRSELELGGATLAASFLYTDTARGIAPESDRADARFWRYPEGRTAMGILSGSGDIGTRSDVTGAVWVQDFRQTIDSFPDANYRTPEARQEDEDLTFGARGIFRTGFARTVLSLSGNFLVSSHDQSDTEFGPEGVTDVVRQSYRQQSASLGLDAEHDLTGRLTVELGAGIDHIDYVESGDFPPTDAITKPVLRLGVAWSFADTMRLRAALGQKSRMPTMRELFGTALNRFLVNPDLQPETIRTAELAFEASAGPAELSLILFGQDVTDTIDQRRVDGLRQRINLDGSTVAGVELAGSAALGDFWLVSGNLTAARLRRKTGPGDTTDRLAERPGLLARLAVEYALPGGLRAGGEMLYTGAAFSFGPEDDLIRLEDAVRLNLHASYPVLDLGDQQAEIYVSLQNALDAPLFDQAGLPAPGRALVGGLRVRL